MASQRSFMKHQLGANRRWRPCRKILPAIWLTSSPLLRSATSFFADFLIKLEDHAEFGRVTHQHGQTYVGRDLVRDKRISGFVFPGEPGFVVQGEFLNTFASVAGEVVEREYNDRYKHEHRFSVLGLRSIDLLTSAYGGLVAERTFALPETLEDQRERLVLIRNTALTSIREAHK